jgi:catechol 2,3-dioxygenase-like lactoylglutathione lyase family enzyme
MLSSAEPVAFLPSTDLERSRTFFESLGLAVLDVSPFACVVRTGPVTLRITRVEALRPQPFTVFGWRVLDIRAAIAGLAGRGVEFVQYEGVEQDADGVWTTPGGDLVAWFHDPDGNTLSLTRA